MRRGAGDLRAGRDQHGDTDHRRADGLDPDGGDHRAGADAPDRHRRLPGMRHDRHHAQLRQAQLSRNGREPARADHARGLLCGDLRPAGPGRDRHPEGHPVRNRAVHRQGRHLQADLCTGAHAEARGDPRRSRPYDQGLAADLLYRRRRDQFRPARGGETARVAGTDRLSGDLDADGPRRLPRLASRLAGHAGHAWQLRSQQCDA